jgi:hypothetical protein
MASAAANVGVVTGQEVFNYLQLKVTVAAQRARVSQVPEYAPIKNAGHEPGIYRAQ